MVRNRRQWIFGILFWIVFLTSIWLGLDGRFEWLDKAWAYVRVVILAAASILVVVGLNRNCRGSAEYFYGEKQDRTKVRRHYPFLAELARRAKGDQLDLLLLVCCHRIDRPIQQINAEDVPLLQRVFRQTVPSFIKFDIFGSFLGFAAQRGRTKGLTFLKKGIPRSGIEVNRGT
jgi:hypothetical protein